MEGYQRREATPVHVLHREPLPDPHWHQTQGIESIYRVNHMRLHLAGTEPPKGLQIHPSQTHSVTQNEEETPTTSLHMPGKEGSVTQGARSDSPTPMETG